MEVWMFTAYSSFLKDYGLRLQEWLERYPSSREIDFVNHALRQYRQYLGRYSGNFTIKDEMIEVMAGRPNNGYVEDPDSLKVDLPTLGHILQHRINAVINCFAIDLLHDKERNDDLYYTSIEQLLKNDAVIKYYLPSISDKTFGERNLIYCDGYLVDEETILKYQHFFSCHYQGPSTDWRIEIEPKETDFIDFLYSCKRIIDFLIVRQEQLNNTDELARQHVEAVTFIQRKYGTNIATPTTLPLTVNINRLANSLFLGDADKLQLLIYLSQNFAAANRNFTELTKYNQIYFYLTTAESEQNLSKTAYKELIKAVFDFDYGDREIKGETTRHQTTLQNLAAQYRGSQRDAAITAHRNEKEIKPE